MGFFSFIETFFFISLIITFVLLAMLVYHFKQRILKLEDKTNTLVEIVNDIVKEMKSVSNLGNINNNRPFVINPPMPATYDSYEVIPENIKTIFLEKTEAEAESDSESESNAESDSDSESDSESEYESDDDNNSDSVPDTETNELPIQELNITENLEVVVDEVLDTSESTIKTIIIDLGNDILEPVEDLDTEVIPENLEPESVVEEPITTEVLSNKKEIYENMTPSALKSIIIQRGITIDVSKMKKNKLVQILLDSDE